MRSIQVILSTIVLLASMSVQADWRVSNGSSVYFQTIKNTDIVETHTINYLSGTIKESGIVEINLHLNSLNSGISVRDERVKTSLFEVSEFPEAKFSGALLDDQIMKNLRSGQPLAFQMNGNLSLHGVSFPITVSVKALYSEASGVLMVSSSTPVIINAQMFGLDSGVRLLKEVAGLESIGMSVPVSFDLILKDE